jgi:hypothetical protein
MHFQGLSRFENNNSKETEKNSPESVRNGIEQITRNGLEPFIIEARLRHSGDEIWVTNLIPR